MSATKHPKYQKRTNAHEHYTLFTSNHSTALSAELLVNELYL